MQISASTDFERLNALRNCAYFADLDNRALYKLVLGMTLYRFEPGEVICWQNEECNGLFNIRTGSVKLFKISPRGRELIVRVLEEGDTFNEVPVFDRKKNPINVAALETSEIWLVDKTLIQKVMAENPQMAQSVILNLCKNLRNFVSMVEELSFQQVTNRLARLMLQLSPEQLSGQTNQRITQDQLAARLGTVREVVARSLRELERSGAIRVSRRKIEILNPQILTAWTQEDDKAY